MPTEVNVKLHFCVSQNSKKIIVKLFYVNVSYTTEAYLNTLHTVVRHILNL